MLTLNFEGNNNCHSCFLPLNTWPRGWGVVKLCWFSTSSYAWRLLNIVYSERHFSEHSCQLHKEKAQRNQWNRNSNQTASHFTFLWSLATWLSRLRRIRNHLLHSGQICPDGSWRGHQENEQDDAKKESDKRRTQPSQGGMGILQLLGESFLIQTGSIEHS